MKVQSAAILVCSVILLGQSLSIAADLSDAPNYRQYNDNLSSSGQPTTAQLQSAAEAGFQRVVYLAFNDNDSAIDNEDRIVKKLGMEYLHIPVDYEKPTVADFRTFAAAMERDRSTKTLVHCQVNFRASTFSFLYRVIFLDTQMAPAKADLDDVWALNEDWFRFVRRTLNDYGLSHDCNGCDWREHEFLDE